MSNIQLPKNIEEIKKFARDNNLDVKYLLGETFVGNLYLPFVESLPANIVFNVSGYLSLYSVKSLPVNIVFNVGGWLSLYSVKSLPDNIKFDVGSWLDLRSAQSLPDNIVFNVDGWLNLESVKSLPKNYSITLGYNQKVHSDLPFQYNNIGENETFSLYC